MFDRIFKVALLVILALGVLVYALKPVGLGRGRYYFRRESRTSRWQLCDTETGEIYYQWRDVGAPRFADSRGRIYWKLRIPSPGFAVDNQDNVQAAP